MYIYASGPRLFLDIQLVYRFPGQIAWSCSLRGQPSRLIAINYAHIGTLYTLYCTVLYCSVLYCVVPIDLSILRFIVITKSALNSSESKLKEAYSDFPRIDVYMVHRVFLFYSYICLDTKFNAHWEASSKRSGWKCFNALLNLEYFAYFHLL